MSRHAAPRRRRDDADLALSRVSTVLPAAPLVGPPAGWCLSPEPTVAGLPHPVITAGLLVEPEAGTPVDPPAVAPSVPGPHPPLLTVGPTGSLAPPPLAPPPLVSSLAPDLPPPGAHPHLLAPPAAGDPPLSTVQVPVPAPHDDHGVLAALRGARLDLPRPGVLGLALVALLCCLLAVVVVQRGRPQPVAVTPVVEQSGAPVEGSAPSSAPPAAAAEVVVAVAGDVARPGLVRLPTGSRVADAVEAAGGLVQGAEAGALNLARVLVDGEQVLVGAEVAAAAPGPAGAPVAPGAAPGPVDLNLASAADLDALPGIGPVLAERIVAWRTSHGLFRSVEQLREVEGIGPAKYDSLRDLVRV